MDAMEENFEGLTEKGWHKEDFKALTSQLKERESLLRLKRRWLMDLSLSIREQKRVEELLPPNDRILPESLIREDDVNYDDIRSCIERGFNAYNCKTEHHGDLEDLQIFNSHDDLKDVFFLLDDMTNKGLYSFVEILTGGSVKYEKSNWYMKKIIREFLPKVLSDESDISKTKLNHILQLLKDVTIFRGYQAVCTTISEAYCAAGIKILDGLEDFPSRALSAMHRKVRGVRGYIPTMQAAPKSGWSRDGLINVIRKKCMKMLLDLGNGNEPAESLAGALGVAGLTLKLILNQPAAIEFRKFSPEIEALQNDIAKAIFSLNDSKRVSLTELKRVQFLLSPNIEMSVRSLRMAIRNLLTEFLFECSDMDEVPNCLMVTLDIFNNRSRLPHLTRSSPSEIRTSTIELMKEEIQKEVEYVLIVSAQAKEIVWNFLPEDALDEDFAIAYMEDFEKSDTLCISDDDEQVRENPQYYGYYSHDSYCGSESICETSPVGFSSLLSPRSKLDVPLMFGHATEMGSDKIHSSVCSAKWRESKILDCSCTDTKQHQTGCIGECVPAYSDPLKVTAKQNFSSLSHLPDTSHNETRSGKTKNYSFATPKLEFSDAPVEQKIPFLQQRKTFNRYFEVQEACDAVSVIAYRFVGNMLGELAKMEGLELYAGDRLYLRSNASVLEDSKGTPCTSSAAKFSKMWKDVLEH